MGGEGFGGDAMLAGKLGSALRFLSAVLERRVDTGEVPIRREKESDFDQGIACILESLADSTDRVAALVDRLMLAGPSPN